MATDLHPEGEPALDESAGMFLLAVAAACTVSAVAMAAWLAREIVRTLRGSGRP